MMSDTQKKLLRETETNVDSLFIFNFCLFANKYLSDF